MHPEYCWQRATGTRTTQRGKAASRPPEAASSSRLSSRCPVSPSPDHPHLGVSRLVRLKGNALSPCPLALPLGLCQASPVRPVGLKFLQEDTGSRGTRGTGVGPDKELEDCACLRPQEDNGLVAPGAGAHVHSHSCQLVPGARVEQKSGCRPAPCPLRALKDTTHAGQGGHGRGSKGAHHREKQIPKASSSLGSPVFISPSASISVSPSISAFPSCHVGSCPCAPFSPTTLAWALVPTQAWPPGPQPSVGTDRIRVRTIQGAWPREGTASSIRGCVLTKLRISSGKALEALYCMPGAAQHPGLGGGEGLVRADLEVPTQGL